MTDVARFERDVLIEAIHEADAQRIVRAAASLEAGGEPLPLLLWTLCEELRTMMSIAAGQRPRRFLQPERMAALAKTAKRHDDASFDRLLTLAHRIDLRAKGVESGDPWNSVVEMALGLAGKQVLADVAA